MALGGNAGTPHVASDQPKTRLNSQGPRKGLRHGEDVITALSWGPRSELPELLECILQPENQAAEPLTWFRNQVTTVVVTSLGAFEDKAQLSRLLRAVEQGEHFTITVWGSLWPT